jgi:Flp pilus assembly protein TadG
VHLDRQGQQELMGGHMRRRAAGGQALVEFALVIPLFLLLIVGGVDLARGVFAYNSVTNAAREGARLAVVNQDTTMIAQRAMSQTAIAETAAPNVTVVFRETTPNADFRTNAVCNPLTVDCVAVVTYVTTYTPLTPILGRILFSGGVTLQAQAVQALEYICPNSTHAANTCPRQP